MRPKFHRLGFSILIVVSVLSLPVAFAQVNEKEKAEKELEKRKELQRKTLGLLDEVVAGAWSMKLPENRSFVLVTAADLFWTHDEKRARSLFLEALNNLNLPNAALGDPATKEQTKKTSSKASSTKGPTKEQIQELNRYYEVFAKRREFLQRVAQRDPQLALDMLHTTRQQPPAQIAGYLKTPDETDLEEEIAGVAATHDPKRALQIARQSLAKGLSIQLSSLLMQLNQQDQTAGSELAADIIAKLNNENLGTNPNALLVATLLLEQSRIPQSAVGESTPQNASYKPLKLEDNQRQGLVDMITNAVLSATGQGNVLQTIRLVMPEIEQFAPDRAVRIKAKLAERNRTLSKDQQEWNTYDTLFEKATPEEMIKAAGKMSDEQRESLYRNAVIKASIGGRSDALREFINSQVEDESRKKGLLDLLDSEQIYEAVYRGKTEGLQKLLPLIRLKEQRALAMAELAILLGKKGEHDAAVKLLDDARLLVKVDLDSEKQSIALLAIILGYALVEPSKAFTMIEPIVDQANDDISKLLLLDKIVKTGIIKNGEIALQQSGIPIDFAMFKYSPGIFALAQADFERTKSLADRFERDELRMLARVLMVRSILRSLEAPTQKTPPAKIQ